MYEWIMNNLLYIKYWELISEVPDSPKFLSQTVVVVFPASISIFPVSTVLLQISQSCGPYRTDLSLSLTGLGHRAYLTLTTVMESGLVPIQSGLRLDSNALLEVSLCLLLLNGSGRPGAVGRSLGITKGGLWVAKPNLGEWSQERKRDTPGPGNVLGVPGKNHAWSRFLWTFC